MKKVSFIVFALIVILTTNLIAQDKSENTTPKFDPARDSFKDLKEVIVDAQTTGKRILLDVGGEWCIWCHRLDGFFDAHPELKNFMHDNFVVLKVNWSPENKNEKFLSQYPKVAGFPHIFILEIDGKFLFSKNTGELEKEKSYDAEKIMNFLKEWAPKKEKS
ncbi:MAG: thioredoxin family protein [Ignavibacteriales bacterium]|nr:thioredoxin family protein [Ignavibacteriales bacterium]